jgi:hypothetical protein
VVQHLGDAEITKFHNPTFREENVLAFEVTMQHVPSVYVLQRQATLHEDGQNLILVEIASFRFALLHSGCEVSTISELHDNMQPGSLNEGGIISDNVDVGQ